MRQWLTRPHKPDRPARRIENAVPVSPCNGTDAAEHEPVMLREALAALNIKADGVYLDATFGRGGHAECDLGKARRRRPVGLPRSRPDRSRGRPGRDLGPIRASPSSSRPSRPSALRRPAARRPAVRRHPVRSRRVLAAARRPRARLQLHAGWSPRHAHERCDRARAPRTSSTARPRAELIRIFRDYGEERYAPRIARAIVADRDSAPFERTLQLAEMIAASRRAANGTSIRRRACFRRCASTSTTSSASSNSGSTPRSNGFGPPGGSS